MTRNFARGTNLRCFAKSPIRSHRPNFHTTRLTAAPTFGKASSGTPCRAAVTTWRAVLKQRVERQVTSYVPRIPHDPAIGNAALEICVLMMRDVDRLDEGDFGGASAFCRAARVDPTDLYYWSGARWLEAEWLRAGGIDT